MNPSIMIEIIVATLLAITIGYCFVLNRKLSSLKKQDGQFHNIVLQISTAVEKAENAVQMLKKTTLQTEIEIQNQGEKIGNLKAELALIARARKNIEKTDHKKTFAKLNPKMPQGLQQRL